MTAKQQQIALLGAVLGAVVVLVAYFFGVHPQLAHKKTNEAAIAAAEAQASTLGSQAAALQQKKNDLPTAQKQMDALVAQFPSDYDQNQWINMLDATASKAKVAVTSITVGNPADPTTSTDGSAPAATTTAPTTGTGTGSTIPGVTPTSVPALSSPLAESSVQLSVSGSTAQLEHFLTAAESMSRPLVINAVTANLSAGVKSTLSITGETYLSQPLINPFDPLSNASVKQVAVDTTAAAKSFSALRSYPGGTPTSAAQVQVLLENTLPSGDTVSVFTPTASGTKITAYQLCLQNDASKAWALYDSTKGKVTGAGSAAAGSAAPSCVEVDAVADAKQ